MELLANFISTNLFLDLGANIRERAAEPTRKPGATNTSTKLSSHLIATSRYTMKVRLRLRRVYT